MLIIFTEGAVGTKLEKLQFKREELGSDLEKLGSELTWRKYGK